MNRICMRTEISIEASMHGAKKESKKAPAPCRDGTIIDTEKKEKKIFSRRSN